MGHAAIRARPHSLSRLRAVPSVRWSSPPRTCRSRTSWSCQISIGHEPGYTDVLGAHLHREYGGDSSVLSFNGTWLLLVTGGEPTSDKPGVTLAAPDDPDRLDHLFTIRTPDCRAAYATLAARGATFLTPPVDHGAETRCFF